MHSERENVCVCVCVYERERERLVCSAELLIAPASCVKTIQRRGNAWPAERPSPLCFGRLPEDSLCFQGTTLQYHPFRQRLLPYLNKQWSQLAPVRRKNPLVPNHIGLRESRVSAVHKCVARRAETWGPSIQGNKRTLGTARLNRKDGNLYTGKISLVHRTQNY